MTVKKLLVLCCVAFLVALALVGCSTQAEQPQDNAAKEKNELDQQEQVAEEKSCMSCHGDYDTLVSAVMAKGEVSGEEVKVVANKVLVDTAFLDTVHGKQGCENCHNGNPQGATVEEAHADLVTNPTADGGQKICGTCHKDTVEKYQTSLHFTANGLYNGLVERIGEITPIDFSTFPEPYNKLGTKNGKEVAEMIFNMPVDGCYSCHADCGDCHISYPVTHGHGGGLQQGHLFTTNQKLEENEQVCAPCHHMVGPMYAAEDVTGHVPKEEFPHGPDVHYEKGLACTDCHQGADEFHGDGKPVVKNMKFAPYADTKCTDCHEDDMGKGTHTQSHIDNVSCFGCHADTYYNCNDCHGSEEGSLNWQYHLGRGKDGKITTYTHNPISENMFFGAPVFKLNEVNTKPFWIQSVPHTIRKVSSDKDDPNYICDRCHSGNYDAFIKEEDFVENGIQFPGADTIVVPKEDLPPDLGM